MSKLPVRRSDAPLSAQQQLTRGGGAALGGSAGALTLATTGATLGCALGPAGAGLGFAAGFVVGLFGGAKLGIDAVERIDRK